MSYINKKVSSRSILAKVYRTINPGDSAWQAGAIEEIGWAIQAIGYHTGFEQMATPSNNPICVKGHRAMIPIEAERVLFVEELLDGEPTHNLLDAEGKNIYVQDDGTCKQGYRLPKGSDITVKSLKPAQGNVKYDRTIAVTPTANYYNLQGDYIVTGYETCEIRIHYMGFAIDEEGLPLVVDDFNYKTFIFWHLMQYMILNGYKIPSIDFGTTVAMCDKYLPKAQNAPKMPSVDGMERFANNWLRYTGKKKQYNNFNVNFEQTEYIDF